MSGKLRAWQVMPALGWRPRFAGRGLRGAVAGVVVVVLLAAQAAAFDLGRAERRTLANGLTVLVLAEPALPLVSVQMVYRVGARSEPAGLTGIAHFLEHMAFRASENFPDTGVVSSIYAVGGEWHGYTWLDQTTYFETLPAEHLELALAIEADRMRRMLVPAAEVEAERGAVLAEMHGYDNDPASQLKDAVLATSFLQHPYRNNTIGWESDVEAIAHADLVAFYGRHYQPGNAVLAVTGRVEPAAVFARVEELFGGFAGRAPTLPPHTVEPLQRGERRVTLRRDGGARRFEVAYRAPAVTHPDYPAFLLLQQVLGGGAGVNFAQNEFGDPVRAGTRLEGLTDDAVTWFPPQELPYVLTIAGSLGEETEPEALEARLEEALAELRRAPPSAGELAKARTRLRDELVFDLETTEDAAHQLAYFEAIGGLGVLLDLPARLARVTAEEVRRVAAEYLHRDRRTVGWYLPSGEAPAVERLHPEAPPTTGEPAATAGPSPGPGVAADSPARAPGATAAGQEAAAAGPTAPAAGEFPGDPAERGAAALERGGLGGTATTASPATSRPARGAVAEEPRLRRLEGGLPLLVQRLTLSPSAHLRLALTGEAVELPDSERDFRAVPGVPLWRHTSVEIRFRPAELDAVLREARRLVDGAVATPLTPAGEIDDPASRLAAVLDEVLGAAPPAGPPRLAAVALAGDLDPAVVRQAAERAFGDLASTSSRALDSPRMTLPHHQADSHRALQEPARVARGAPAAQTPAEIRVAIAADKAQAQLGYVVAAPPPSDPAGHAWRILLYVLSHGYEGRLGKEAISRRGLVYWIGAEYGSDGREGRVTLEIGVDPPKLEAMRELLAQALAELRDRPPSDAEIDEAKAHLLGRRRSAAQSNAEVTARLLEDWLGRGALASEADLAAALAAVTRADVLAALPAFVAGTTVVVEVGR